MDAWVRPRSTRFQTSDTNLGTKNTEANLNIINPTPIYASRTLVAGFISGYTSPARPWFKLTLPEVPVSLYPGVAQWVSEVEQLMRDMLLMSNFYEEAMVFYEHLANIGTAVYLMEEDDKAGLRFDVATPGSYCLTASYRQQIDTLYREVAMTAEQLYDEFGPEKVSRRVRDMVDQGKLDEWVDVLHVVEPNREHIVGSVRHSNRPWLSTKMEVIGDGEHDEKLLSQKGYFSKPFAVGRWEIIGNDVYGSSCPGFAALPASKSLQHIEKRTARLKDKMADPPLRAPQSMRNQTASLLPGSVNYDADSAGGARMEPVYIPHPQGVAELKEEIARFESHIERAYFVDMWLHLTQMQAYSGREMTAREVDERHHEKMMMLGPVIERLGRDFLTVIIDRAWDVMVRQGRLPPPPAEVQGANLKPEFISVLAQAQKAIGYSSMQEWAMAVQSIGQTINPEALDKIRVDRYLDLAAEMLGVPPEVNASAEEVERIRQARAQQIAEQQAAEQAQSAAKAGKDLSQAKLTDDNALARVLQQFGSVTAGQTRGGIPSGGGS